MEKNGNYELLYIVHPDLESSIDKVTGKIKASIEKRGGKIKYEENWGKRKLAYEIKKNDVGIYILWFFTAPKKSLAKIEKEIRLTEEIVRYLILTIIEEPKKTQKPKTEGEPEKKMEKPQKENPETKETEKDRMKKIDEKLGALLGEEDNKKKPNKKEA